MNYIYSFFILLSIPFVIIYLLYKRIYYSNYKRNILCRFFINKKIKNLDIWIHVSSLGEIKSVAQIINYFILKKKKILITTMTHSGYEYIKNKLHGVYYQYVPYEIPIVLKIFFSNIRPKIGIITETELWPNLIHYAHNFGIPLFLINARLSDNSYKIYKKFIFFLNQF